MHYRDTPSCSSWSRLLMVCVAIGFVDTHTTSAEDRIASDTVVRLNGPFCSVDFLHHGKTRSSGLVACDKAGRVKVYDNAGKEQRSWRVGGGLQEIFQFKISGAADAYAAMGSEGELVFGRLDTPEKVTRGDSKYIYSGLLFSQDGTWVALFGPGAVQFWRTAGWVEHPHESWSGPHIHESLAFLQDGNEDFFVTAGFGTRGAIGKWSLPGGEKTHDFQGDERMDRKFIHIATSPDSRWLVGVSCGAEKLVVWDVGSGEIVARPNAFPSCVGNRLAFSGDGKILVCSQFLYKTGFKIYRVDGWKELGHFVLAENYLPEDSDTWGIIDVAVDFTGSNVATRHADGHVRLWSVASASDKGQK